MTMTDDSLLKTGNTSGGQSGLRYNPRETAGDEVGYGVSHTKYNPRDPDEKQKDEEEKDKQKEKRAHAKAGLQHIKVKVKNKKREEEEARKKEAEISELTGPAASGPVVQWVVVSMVCRPNCPSQALLVKAARLFVRLTF